MMQRAHAVEQLKSMYGILSADMDDAVAYSAKHSNPFAHRTVVRTLFSLIEGLAFQLRQVTIASLEPHAGSLTVPELALLREERYYLNAKGEPEAGENFQKFLPNLLFTIRSYGKNHGATFQADTSTHGWQAMQHAVNLRNRITHPKSVADLTLSEQDQKYLIDASAWWKKTLLEMFDACDTADAEWIAKSQRGGGAG
jgi:hypothetical protein